MLSRKQIIDELNEKINSLEDFFVNSCGEDSFDLFTSAENAILDEMSTIVEDLQWKMTYFA